MNTYNAHGPWSIFKLYTGQVYVKDKRGHSVCEVKDHFFQGKTVTDREGSARLIASTPALLEALEWVLATRNQTEAHKQALEMAQRAVEAAKA
jgi:hypothetical protein